MSNHPIHDQQREQWLIGELLAPKVRALCKSVTGQPVSIRDRIDEVERAFFSEDEFVQVWIEAGASMTDLAWLLQERPDLLDMNLIRQQLFHLRALATGHMSLADSFGGLAAVKQASAHVHLQRIAEGLVRGLMPGYSVKIIRDVPNGRPRAINYKHLFADLKGILGALDFLLKSDSFLLLKRQRESQPAFRRRIAAVTQNLYQSSHLCFKASMLRHKPFLNKKGQPAVSMDPRFLDLASAWKIARRATGNAKSASLRLLVLGVLEVHYQISARALENHLARLKDQDPDRFGELLERFPMFRGTG